MTRPSSISGKPVKADTSVTATPLARSVFAVPPVDRISMPSAASAPANLSHPDLSVRLISARWARCMDLSFLCSFFFEKFSDLPPFVFVRPPLGDAALLPQGAALLLLALPPGQGCLGFGVERAGHRGRATLVA